MPELVRAPVRVVPVVDGVAGTEEELLGVELLVVVRVALVEPDILPAHGGHAVTEPLVGELVDHDGLIVALSWHILMKGSIIAVAEGDPAAAQRAKATARDLIDHHRQQLPLDAPE